VQAQLKGFGDHRGGDGAERGGDDVVPLGYRLPELDER
jgi:hypothetical protein